MSTRRTVGVIGARGGAGASCLAAALAAAAARERDTVLVDADLGGGGLDVLLGIEDEPGLRWPDLAGARGQVAADDVVPLLPAWEHASVLSCDHRRPAPPSDEVVRDVLDALGSGGATVVLDLPRAAVVRRPGLLDGCPVVLLVVPCDVAGIAGAHALLGGPLREVAAVWVVAAASPGQCISSIEVADAVDRPLSGVVRCERSTGQAVDRGFGPLLGRRRRLHRVAEELWTGVRDLLDGPGPSAVGARTPDGGRALEDAGGGR